MNAFYIRMSVLLQRMRIFVFRRAGTGRSKGSAVHNRRHDSGNFSPGCDMLKQIMRARRAYWMQAGLPALPIFHTMNKHIKSLWLLPVAGLSLSLMPSCTTDSYGNSTVTPGGAAAIGVGALAAGAAIGAAVQHDRDKDRYRNDWHHHNPPPPPPRPPHRPHWRR